MSTHRAEAQMSSKKMKTLIRFIFIFAAVVALNSCRTSEESAPNISAEMTIHGLGEEHWTYFSFEKGEVVGTGKFDDDDDDAAWAQRKDWDFAICGKYIKTNSGDSGIGKGGIQKNNTDNYATLATAPTEGYLTDEEQIIR